MRYFKVKERWGEGSETLWERNEHGEERCTYDPSLVYEAGEEGTTDWNRWSYPQEMESLPFLLKTDPQYVTELTKDEYFLEMI